MFDDMFPSPSLQSQHQLLHLHPHLLSVPPPDRNPTMPCSTLVRRMKKAFMASVASGQQEMLPPIPPAAPQQQQKQPQHLGTTCSSFSCSSLPEVVQGDPTLLQLLLREGVSLIPKPGAPRLRGRKNLTGHAHLLEPLPHKTAPGGVASGSSISISRPLPTTPAPPQTTNSGQLRSRLPRLKKTTSLSIAAAVEGE